MNKNIHHKAVIEELEEISPLLTQIKSKGVSFKETAPIDYFDSFLNLMMSKLESKSNWAIPNLFERLLYFLHPKKLTFQVFTVLVIGLATYSISNVSGIRNENGLSFSQNSSMHFKDKLIEEIPTDVIIESLTESASSEIKQKEIENYLIDNVDANTLIEEL